MKPKVVVHEAEEGGFWAEVPAIPGCATQGESFEELLHDFHGLDEAHLGTVRKILEEQADVIRNAWHEHFGR